MFRFVSVSCLVAMGGLSESLFKATSEASEPADEIAEATPPLEDEATRALNRRMRKDTCSEVVTAFDIEEVSELQDAVSPFLADLKPPPVSTGLGGQDALILDYNIPDLGEGESWRISAVYVLVMVATGRFDSFPDGLPLTVEVFDAPDPRAVPGWTVTETVQKGDLTWDNYAPFDAAISGSFSEYTQKGSLACFDMTDASFPKTGMTSDQFVVGIQWKN